MAQTQITDKNLAPTGTMPAWNGSALMNLPDANITSLEQSISTLALHMAVSDNKSSFNLPDSFIDHFENTNGIGSQSSAVSLSEECYSIVPGSTPSTTTKLLLHFDNNSNDSSEFSNNPTTTGGSVVYESSDKKFGTHAARFDGSNDYFGFNQSVNGAWLGAGDFGIDFWTKPDSDALSPTYRAFYGHQGQDASNYHALNFLAGTAYLHTWNNALDTTSNPLTLADWNHVLVQRHNDYLKIWVNGNLCSPVNGLFVDKNFNTPNQMLVGWDGANAKYKGIYDEFRICNHAPTVTVGDGLYIGNDTGNFTPMTSAYEYGSGETTGTLETIASTSSDTVSSISGVMLYEDSNGTATLGTDLTISFSADNGLNWTPASSYSSPITFAGSVKVVKLGKTTISNTGTQIKMKAEWANQDGDKTTKLHGWAVNY